MDVVAYVKTGEGGVMFLNPIDISAVTDFNAGEARASHTPRVPWQLTHHHDLYATPTAAVPC